MMKLKKRGVLRNAAAILCVAGSFGMTQVQAQAQTVSIGSVDEAKLGDGYNKYKEAMARLDTRVKSLDEQLPARVLMTADEGKRFDTLVVKENRSAQEESSLQATVKAGLDRRAQFIRLSGLEKRSDNDIAIMKKLQEQATGNEVATRTISDSVYSVVKKLDESTNKKYLDEAKNVIGQIATERKLSLVVRQSAIVWSAPTVDITTEVLARLNK